MKSLKKFSKKELVSLCEQYEIDINDLTDELETLSLNPDRVKYVYKNTDDDKVIKYLKNRLKCVRGMRRLPYIREYERLMGIDIM
mgnify:CR=1 FL=1